MQGGFQDESMEYGVLMPSPQFTQQATSIGMSTVVLKCFHDKQNEDVMPLRKLSHKEYVIPIPMMLNK